MASSPTATIGTERRLFPPPGSCIYCGATNSLTDEHILPYGLGGNYIFEKASCRMCAKETGRIEQRCLRGTMWSTRLKLRLQSRSGAPDTLPVYTSDHEGQPTQRHDIGVSDYPECMVLLNLPPPSILLGLSPPAPNDKIAAKAVIYEGPGFKEAVKKLGRRFLEVRTPTPSDLCRMLAKIGHAHAFADLAQLPPFAPLLPDLILGRCQTPTHLVGCINSIIPEPEIDIVHRVHTQVAHLDHASYLLVCIRLFANIGAPEFHVVVGALRESSTTSR